MIKFDSVLMQPLLTCALHQHRDNSPHLPISLLPTPYSLLPFSESTSKIENCYNLR
ncbi:MAG: hypothetical protein F6J94_08160 [Moorea sp. SIO1F2]|uniref:hypothetical protein n=1 Tax=Moorena sp. SIO1F2 TaxID=2607819 RepID=UPI0013BD0F53|nr:hypothetical protein [Moorena sp. SIO1F2]NET81916.1 hypothetical protein [Moorena sp. SIO1F2]